MNTARWLTNRTPELMFRLLGQTGETTERKYRLLAVACYRRVRDQLPDAPLRALIDVQEAFADDEADDRALRSAINAVLAVYYAARLGVGADRRSAFHTLAEFHRSFWPRRISEATSLLAAGRVADPSRAEGLDPHRDPDYRQARRDEERAQADLIREIFGDPFRPSDFDPAWLLWEGGTISRMASAIYEEKAFERMPILGDALEEAGCGDDRILAHCRKSGGHVRGCWVVDALIGKAWSPGPPDFPPPRPTWESVRH